MFETWVGVHRDPVGDCEAGGLGEAGGFVGVGGLVVGGLCVGGLRGLRPMMLGG